jgi:hypothetical protein
MKRKRIEREQNNHLMMRIIELTRTGLIQWRIRTAHASDKNKTRAYEDRNKIG